LIEVVPFEREHLDRLIDVPDQLGDLTPLGDQKSIAFTGLMNGTVIGCAGAFRLWPGVGEAWAAFSAMPPKQARACVFEVKRRLPGFMRDAGFHRLQASVLAEHINACRLARAIGLEFEGFMKAYDSSKNDYVRYGKVM